MEEQKNAHRSWQQLCDHFQGHACVLADKVFKLIHVAKSMHHLNKAVFLRFQYI